MNLLKKISVVSILMVSMGTVGYGATVVVPRVSVVRVPTSRPTVNTPKPSVTKSTSNTFNKSSNGTTPKSSESKSSTVEKSFSESSGRSSFFDSMSGAITGSWLYNSLFNNHYSSDSSNNDNKESPSDGSDNSCGLWDWINNNIEYLKRVLLGE